MKLFSAVVLSLAAASLAAPAFAQQGGGGGGMGRMTPEQREARFVESDTDKNGLMSKAEFVASLPEQAKARADTIWARLDVEGKGSVTKEQFVALRMGQGGGGQAQ